MSDNKRIAKNTFFLYIRMFLNMAVSLYTSRLVLEALGVIDYGIYGLVGGIVTIFSFLNSSMSSATQRYLTFDIGRNNTEKLRNTFNATLNIHILISLLLLILSETIGLWFINNKLDIPINRMNAANWVYQFSLFTFLIGVIQVPYNALIIAREKMNVYAYVGILETLLKLFFAWLLINSFTDRLILYSILMFFLTLIIRIVYKIYCNRNFEESIYKFYFDKKFYKELISFTGWSLFGNIAVISRNQGSNILLNIFFGPTANAAYALTLIIQNTIGKFIRNFQVAVNPQIVKNYSIGKKNKSLDLMFISARLSFFAMLILIIPFLYNIDFIMQFWLKEVPPFSVDFIKLALIYSLIETISNPLMIGAQATGKIKWYQITIGTFIFLTFPAAWLVFSFNQNPRLIYWVLIASSLIALIFRVLFLKKMMGLDIKIFIREIIVRIFKVSICIIFLLNILSIDKAQNLIELAYHTFLLLCLTTLIILFLGVSNDERKYLCIFIKKKLNI